MSILSALQPAINKFAEKQYPIEPDLLCGWKIKVKGFRQIPIKYNYQPVDSLVKQYTQFSLTKQQQDFRIVYLGPRYNTNLKGIRAYCQKQYDIKLKQSLLYEEKQMIKYSYTRKKQKDIHIGLDQLDHRLFIGMNPTLQSNDQLVFDSDFECGNLDMAMKVNNNQYDLFMRVDSNTKGHSSWYFFKVKNTRKGNKIVFNICNFHKKNSLYQKGMRPYVFQKSDPSKGWKQAQIETTYKLKGLRYESYEQYYKPLYCLSFEFEFQNDFDEVYFSYGVPYSYSYLLTFIDSLVKIPSNKQFIKYDKQNQSISGLIVPVLTITNSNSNQNKKVILITGRLHPGQTQGSWVLHGFINFLCSPQAEKLRDIIIFKIIPMVNVDGVVLGNFRTSIKGADLNRKFKNSSSTSKGDEIDWVKKIADKYDKNLHTYLDFHGHSTNKSAFIYGSQYPMNHENYFSSRLFPKMISQQTQMFRYYSCSFRIPQHKQTTARAVMFREHNIPFCFTIQTSNYAYYDIENGQTLFSKNQFLKLGQIIAIQQQQFMYILIQIQKRKQFMKLLRNKKSLDKLNTKTSVKLKSSKVKNASNFLNKMSQIDPQLELIVNQVYKKHNLLSLKQEIEIQNIDGKKQLDHNQSKLSDCESSEQDYSQQQLKSFFNQKDAKTGTEKVKKIKKSLAYESEKNRSISNRFPPAEPIKVNKKQNLQIYKLLPRTLSIENQSQLFSQHRNLFDKNKIRQNNSPFKQHSKSKLLNSRQTQVLQIDKPRELRSQNISVSVGLKQQLTSKQKSDQYFIYRHVKNIVLPELYRHPVTHKKMKVRQRKSELSRAAENQSRKEQMIEKRIQNIISMRTNYES